MEVPPSTRSGDGAAAPESSADRAPTGPDPGRRSATQPGPESIDETLSASAWNGAEALYLLDAAMIVEAWNPGSEGLWGILVDEAVGRRLDDLIDWQPVSGPGRDISGIGRSVRSWSERTLDRPLLGTRRGELIVVDAHISIERDDAGAIRRFVVSSTDVTRSVQLGTDMVPLGVLATSGGTVRDRNAIASQALDILRTATGADEGVVALIRDEGYDFLAEINPARFGPLFERIDPRTSPLIEGLRAPGHIVAGDPVTMTLEGDARDLAASLGLRWMVLVALWGRGQIRGLLALGWATDLPDRPFDLMVLQAAAHLSAALENARLMDEVGRSFEAERMLSARLEALVGLARLTDSSDAVSLAYSVLEQLVPALGAQAGAVWRLHADRWEPIAEVDIHPAISRLRVESPAADFGTWGPSGDPLAPYIRPFTKGHAREAAVAAAREAGYVARAVFPIVDDGRVEKLVGLFFGGDPRDIGLDERTLDAIGRSVAAAFANQSLRERLVSAAATQRGLAEQYGAMFRDSPDALLLIGKDRIVVDLNGAALAMIGGSRRDWVGQSSDRLSEATPEERDQRAHLALSQARATYAMVGRRIDGTTFPVEATTAHLVVGNVDRVLIHVRDLTDEKRVQRELVQAQKMEAVGQLVAGVAHELNNPLAAIVGFSQIIRDNAALPAEMRDDAGLLMQESTRTRRIVDNLLNFARQRPPERHPTKLTSLVTSVLELQSFEFASGRIQTVVDIPDGLPAVPLDRSQMQQVILNLVQNALQAIRRGSGSGTISITAKETIGRDGKQAAILSVSDDGPGVPESIRDQLFMPFVTTKEPGDGTGLGLSVSFGIVAGHAGQLTFAPRDGGGAAFTIELPLEQPAEPERTAAVDDAPDPPAVSPGATEVPGHLRVLVLDDEPAIRTFLSRVLRSAGMDATLAGDGPEALALVEAGAFDAMLCDHRMAGMNGAEVYEAVAATKPDLARRFVLMSGDILSPELRDFAGKRDIHLLAKPFEIGTILEVVRAAAGGSGVGQLP